MSPGDFYSVKCGWNLMKPISLTDFLQSLTHCVDNMRGRCRVKP